MKIISSVMAFVSVILTLLLISQPASAHVTVTSVQDLGTLGGDYSHASGINDNGQVVGMSKTASGDMHAFLWTAQDGMVDLGTLGGTDSRAHGINSAGQVVGESLVAPFTGHAFLWENGVMKDLGTLPGGNSWAYGINDIGQVVGGSHTASYDEDAFLWTAQDGMVDLGTLGGPRSRAHGINIGGQIVGFSTTISGVDLVYHAILWTAKDSMVDLGTLGGNSWAYGINGNGQVAGGSLTASGLEHAFLWTAQDGMVDLGTLPGGTQSRALGINDAGQVVGIAGHAFLWTAQDGMVDLGTLPGGGSSWANGINNKGQIVGASYYTPTEAHATLWTYIVNTPPAAVAGGPYTGDEGSAVTFVGSATDPDAGDSISSYQWDFGDGETGSGATALHTYKDNKLYTVSLTVTDSHGATDTKTTTANIANVAPTVGPIIAPTDPQPVSTTISISSPFTDPGVIDTHTATIDWNDGTWPTAGTVTETDGSGSVTGSHPYSTPGVYTITLTVTDKDKEAGTSGSQYVVIYDPDGGFVTGGGWIDSPANACPSGSFCEGASGRANFGFVSKYQKGVTVPSGETEFQFQAGDLNFHSNTYDWLVIAGQKAMYKGRGNINGGAEQYKFILSAIDSGTGDKFRIKITDMSDNVVYDNQIGSDETADPTTVISGGSIVIHAKK